MATRMKWAAALLCLFALTAWSQDDRQRIAFQREGSSLVPGNIMIMFSDQQKFQELGAYRDIAGRRITPALSPDGQTIAFAAKVGDRFQLYTWKLDDQNVTVGTPVRLTQTDNADATFPAWSPDGMRLAYLNTDEDNRISLRTINRDGTGLKVLIQTNYALSAPSWSPDGQSLLYIDKVAGEKGTSRLALRQYPITGGPAVDIRPKSSIAAACYSPDGAKIAALVRRADGLSDLWILTPPGLNGLLVTQKLTDARGVAWPTAGSIYVRASKVGDKGGSPFWIVPVDGGAPKGLTGYADPKQITHFSVQRASAVDMTNTLGDPNDATGGVNPAERVPTGPVTISRPFNDATVRGVVPIKITAWKDVASVVIRINNQFVYAAAMPEADDQSASITYRWNTQQMINFEPSMAGTTSSLTLPNLYKSTLRYPDGAYTLTVLGIKRDETTGKESLAGSDTIKVSVENNLPTSILPNTLMLRYQYREIDPDEEFRIRGEGTVFGAGPNELTDLDAVFEAKVRRALVEVHPTGKYDLRTTIRPLVDYPLTFGQNGARNLPEDGVSALYALMPNGSLEVIPQQREKVYLPLAQVWVPLPNDAVQVGAQWTGEMWVVNNLLDRQGVVVNARNTLDGVEWIGDRRTVRIRSEFTIEADKYGTLGTKPAIDPPALAPNRQTTTSTAAAPVAPPVAAGVPGAFGDGAAGAARATAASGLLKTTDVTGVRYSWFDYERGQILRVEDVLSYKFPLANLVAMQPVRPVADPGMGAGIYPGGMAPGGMAPGGMNPGGMNPGGVNPGAGMPGGMFVPGMNPGTGLPGGMGLEDEDTPGAGAAWRRGAAAGGMAGGMMPPGMMGGGGMAEGEDVPGAGAAWRRNQGAGAGQPGMGTGLPGTGMGQPGAGMGTGTGQPGAGATRPAAQPKPRTGNGFYLVRWTYSAASEEPADLDDTPTEN